MLGGNLRLRETRGQIGNDGCRSARCFSRGLSFNTKDNVCWTCVFAKTPAATSLHYIKGLNLTKRGIITVLSAPLTLQMQTAFTLAFTRRTKTVSDLISQTAAVLFIAHKQISEKWVQEAKVFSCFYLKHPSIFKHMAKFWLKEIISAEIHQQGPRGQVKWELMLSAKTENSICILLIKSMSKISLASA